MPTPIQDEISAGRPILRQVLIDAGMPAPLATKFAKHLTREVMKSEIAERRRDHLTALRAERIRRREGEIDTAALQTFMDANPEPDEIVNVREDGTIEFGDRTDPPVGGGPRGGPGGG